MCFPNYKGRAAFLRAQRVWWGRRGIEHCPLAPEQSYLQQAEGKGENGSNSWKHHAIASQSRDAESGPICLAHQMGCANLIPPQISNNTSEVPEIKL